MTEVSIELAGLPTRPTRMARDKLLLLDGNSLTYRAFFALPPGHVDGQRAAHQRRVRVHVDVHQRAQGAAARRRAGRLRPARSRRSATRPTPTYKANRDAAPDILRQQMGLVREVLDALGVATCELAGWEADDLIATATEQAVARGDDVVIVTGDRDAYQLVKDPHVKVLYNRRGVSDYALYDEAGIVERTGVTPAQYPEYAALRGDPSDNLPGVPGVGEKTAAKLINDVRRARRHLRPRRRADAEAAGVARRARGAGPQEPPGDDPAPRRADRAARVAGDEAEHRPRSSGCSTSSSSARSPSGSPRRSGRPPSCSRPTSASSSSPRSPTSESPAATARRCSARSTAARRRRRRGTASRAAAPLRRAGRRHRRRRRPR